MTNEIGRRSSLVSIGEFSIDGCKNSLVPYTQDGGSVLPHNLASVVSNDRSSLDHLLGSGALSCTVACFSTAITDNQA